MPAPSGTSGVEPLRVAESRTEMERVRAQLARIQSEIAALRQAVLLDDAEPEFLLSQVGGLKSQLTKARQRADGQSLADVRMPFAKYFEEESPKFAQDTRYSRGLLPYQELQGYIQNMQNLSHGRDLQARRSKTLRDECAICLEPLGPACVVTTTACKHSFHTYCLVETLGNGVCTSCPLCRTEIEKLVPIGLDGQLLKLVATLRISSDEAQRCHKAIFDEIAYKAALCESDIQSRRVWRFISLADKKKKRIRQRLQALLDQLEVLRAFSRVNVEGFSRICGQIDLKVSSELSKLILAKYVHNRGYCKDFAEDGNGLATELGNKLNRMVERVGGSCPEVAGSCGFKLLLYGRPSE